MNSLVPKNDFIGISNVAHLAAGGETPCLRSHFDTIGRFVCDKGEGMPGRARVIAEAHTAKQALARLLGGRPEDLALLGSASEGLCVAAAGIDWRPGDNVVVERVEYASVRYAWERLPHRVALRTVGGGPMASPAEIRAAVDGRTRAIGVSHVSYLTGARHDLAALREIADTVGARLVVDASHALGVVGVDGSLCDVVVSCAYKFLLGVHGVGVFYVNRDRWPDLAPPWVGWHSAVSMDWPERSERPYELKPDAERFEIGNLAWLNVAVLANALGYLERLGTAKIEAHVLALGDELWHGLHALDRSVTTPRDRTARAASICFTADASERIAEQLRRAGVIVWGSEGRIRMSLHLYNDSLDVSRALAALAAIR